MNIFNGIKLRQLQYFLAVADKMHFYKAAEKKKNAPPKEAKPAEAPKPKEEKKQKEESRYLFQLWHLSTLLRVLNLLLHQGGGELPRFPLS